MAGLLPFFILLTAGLVFSELFRKLDLPYVLALILAGIIIGPVFGFIGVDPTISLIGSIGLVFLMFMAGSHVKLENFKKLRTNIISISVLNGALPFIVGFGIATLFGYGLYTALIMGIVFISSSIAVIVPTLERHRLLDTKLGQTIIASTVFEDVGSLIFFAFILQNFTQKTILPLPIYVPTILFILVALKMIIPTIEKKYYAKKRGRDLFESELRFIFVTLLATVVLFEFLGLHAIIAGFIIGILLSNSIKGKTEEKIHTISYGFFIPIFFLVLGMQTDLSVFLNPQNIALVIAVVAGLIISKVFSGYLGGRANKFSKGESFIIGFSTMPQLSTTLAAAYAALEFGILTPELISVLVVLSVVTTVVSPMAIRFISKRITVKGR